MSVVAFLVVIAVVGVVMYTLLIQRAVPGVAEQRFGVLEPLPDDVGKWVSDTESEQGAVAVKQGLRREVRMWHDPNKPETLTKQVRYKNPATGAIVRVDPEETVKRRRIKQT
jgi:hypothetical protein